MALIDGYGEPRNQNRFCAPGVQRYLEFLQSTVRGEPGRPVADPAPYRLPPEASELVDGVPPEPKPERSRKRKPARTLGPALDRDSVNLARYARKLRGEP